MISALKIPNPSYGDESLVLFPNGDEAPRSTPHDQLLLKTSDSFSGLLLVAIGFLLFMVSFVRDRDFQHFFAKGYTFFQVFMALWMIYFEHKVEDLAWDWLRQTVGDILLALSWGFFLVYSWREKYD